MNTTMRRCTVGLVLALGLVGCATTSETRPPTGSDLFGCDRVPFDGPVPEPVRPERWEPQKSERGYLHIRFFVAKGSMYAIGVPVNSFKGETPFFVGPMADLPGPFDPKAAPEELKRHPDWAAFYHQLARAYGDSRPMALVCPGRDCPITPEGPPPAVAGMTVSGSGSLFGSLDPSSDQRLAALDQAAAATATDAPFAAQGRSEDIERQLRELFSDTVTRAVCAARILGGGAKK
jgi:hypothetical protein